MFKITGIMAIAFIGYAYYLGDNMSPQQIADMYRNSARLEQSQADDAARAEAQLRERQASFERKVIQYMQETK